MPKKNDDKLSPATNLVNQRGQMEDPPTTTYLLVAQQFQDGKQLEWIQDVELSYDEYYKLRRYLADIRGLIPAKGGTGVAAPVRGSLQEKKGRAA